MALDPGWSQARTVDLAAKMEALWLVVDAGPVDAGPVDGGPVGGAPEGERGATGR